MGDLVWVLGVRVRLDRPILDESGPFGQCRRSSPDPKRPVGFPIPASSALEARLEIEEDGWVREEIEAALPDVD